MRPLIKSLLMYLLIIGLVAFNLIAVYNRFSIYVMYIIIILVVIYLNPNILWGRNVISGLLIGTSLIGIVFGIEILANWVKIEGFDFNPNILLSYFILQIIVALGEEISFRGYILPNVISETGPMTGIFLSSLMFSTIHVPSIIYYGLDISRGIVAFFVIGLLGAIAAIFYLKYGLLSAIGFHFAWNFLQYNVFTLSDIHLGLIKSSYLEPSIITGGNYGPEAGILGFIVVFLAFEILIKKISKS
jgi:membrane protease YdiL (CAAX protease family)